MYEHVIPVAFAPIYEHGVYIYIYIQGQFLVSAYGTPAAIKPLYIQDTGRRQVKTPPSHNSARVCLTPRPRLVSCQGRAPRVAYIYWLVSQWLIYPHHVDIKCVGWWLRLHRDFTVGGGWCNRWPSIISTQDIRLPPLSILPLPPHTVPLAY